MICCINSFSHKYGQNLRFQVEVIAQESTNYEPTLSPIPLPYKHDLPIKLRSVNDCLADSWHHYVPVYVVSNDGALHVLLLCSSQE